MDKLGGRIENWEDDWLEIEVQESKCQDMLNALHAMEAGQYGDEAKMVAEKYSVTAVYDDDDGHPGDDVQSSYTV